MNALTGVESTTTARVKTTDVRSWLPGELGTTYPTIYQQRVEIRHPYMTGEHLPIAYCEQDVPR